MDQPLQSPQTIPKVPACTECRKRRAKCDGTDTSIPCSYCIRTNKQCIYQEVRRRQVKSHRRRQADEDRKPADTVMQTLNSDEKWSNILSQVNKGVPSTFPVAAIIKPPAKPPPRACTTPSPLKSEKMLPYGVPSRTSSDDPFRNLSFQQQQQQQQQQPQATPSLSPSSISPTSNTSLSTAASSMSPTSNSTFSLSPISNTSPSTGISNGSVTGKKVSSSSVSNISAFYPPVSTNSTGNTSTNTASGGSTLSFPTAALFSPSSSPIEPSDNKTEDWSAWTGVKIDASTALELVELFFSSGYYPVLHRTPFMKDFLNPDSGFDYCSRPLVSAILALSCKRSETLLTVKTSGEATAQAFFEEAVQALNKQADLPRSMPDSQATALLALYQMSFGDGVLAAKFAGQAVEHSQAYYELTDTLHLGDVWHQYVRLLTLCGSVSLARMISLFAGQSSKRSQTAELLAAEISHIVLTGPILTNLEVTSMLPPVENDEKPLQRVMTFKYFELTDIAHNALRPRPNDEVASQDPLAAHDKCMQWYETVSIWIPQLLGNDAFAELLQLFYFFCTLSVWHSCLRTAGNRNYNGFNVAKYASGICDVASRGIFDFSLSIPLSPYLQSAPYLWSQFIFAAAKAQLRILLTIRASPTDNYEKLQSVETDTLIRRAYIQSAIARLQGMRNMHPCTTRLCRELEREYNGVNEAASRAWQTGA